MIEQVGAEDRLDLLPPAFRRKMLRQTRRRQWSIILGASAVFTLAICFGQHQEYRTKQQGLEARRLRAAPIEAIQAQNVDLRKRLVRIRNDQRLRAELESEQVAFPLLATISRSAATCIDGVQVQQFSFSRTRSTVSAAPANSPPANPAGSNGQPQQTEIESLVLTVRGIGADNLMVSRFVVALRDSQVFDKVDLKSSMGSTGPSRGVRTFVVECTL